MDVEKGLSITTDDFWYDLFEGGYIKPKNVLVNMDDILLVERAKNTLIEFKQTLDDAGILEEM